MKKSAKILSIILALVMILSAIPVATFAADDEFVFNGSTITSYKGAGGDIVIPDTLNGKPVTGIGDWVFERNDSITSVVIPDSVTSIGRQAFYLCSNLKDLTIGSGLTSIGDEAFIYCPNLENITVAPDNTVYDSRNNCNAIIETATNTLCLGAANTVIPDTVTAIATQAFFYRTSLEGSMVIPEGVTRIGYQAFRSCINLEGITIPSSVTTIGSEAFITCWSLESIVVDPDNTVYDSRDNCNAIIETASNRLIVGCKNTVIPDSVVSIANYAFFDSTGLESITLTDKITVGYEAFYGCKNLKTVYYPCDNNLSTIKGNMSSYGTLTYTPIHDEITYTDNGDGTHTGSCACGSSKTEKEAHTFVDDVCTLCGAEKAFKTIREILDTVPDFPTTEEDAWTNENGAKVYLTFEGIWQIVFPDMQSGVNNVVVKSGDNYYESYVPDTIYVTKDGVLDCIIVSRSVEGDLNGTYRPACKHPNAYTVPEKAVTCTEDGHSAYLYCPDCDEALEVYDVYVALNHAYAEDVDGKAATCTEDGLTDGKYCPDCDTWIVPREVIPATGEHKLINDYIDNNDGTHSQKCSECGQYLNPTEHTFVDGVCVCGALKPVTVLDVISTNKDFPTDIANAWLNEDGSTLICKTDTNTILFATAAGDNTSNIGLNCEVKADGDNYIFNDFIFNMEDGVLKSVTMIDQYSSLKGTYAPHTHAYTDSYVDNGDGTHTGSCACGAVNPEKEEHTFVNGVCVCGAKEPVKELEIISITEKSDAIIGELVDLEVLVSKPVKKVAFIDANGNTFTYATTSANTVSVVNNDDGTQVWTVKLTVRHSVDEYAVKVKERSSGSWSEKTYDLNIEGKKPPVYDEIISVEVPDEANNEIKYGTHDIIITTGKDVSRVQIAYAGTTATYSKSSSKATVEEDGDTLVWTISFNFFKNDLITYDFSSRSSTGSWKAFGESKVIYTYKKTSEMK